jgi:hypothetical protein
MSNSKIRISNPQALNGEWFYIDGILYTITDFRWDGGHNSGEFKGYLSTSIPQIDSPNINVDIYFYMNTKEQEIKFETSLPNWGVSGVSTVSTKEVSIPIRSIDSLRRRDTFKLILSEGLSELIQNNSYLQKIIYSSRNYSGSQRSQLPQF